MVTDETFILNEPGVLLYRFLHRVRSGSEEETREQGTYKAQICRFGLIFAQRSHSGSFMNEISGVDGTVVQLSRH